MKAAGSATKPPAITALTTSTLRKPKRRRIGGAANFMAIAPIAAAKVMMPDWNGVMPKPTCRSSGRRNGVAPTPMRKRSAPIRLVAKVGMRKSERSRIGFAIRRL